MPEVVSTGSLFNDARIVVQPDLTVQSHARYFVILRNFAAIKNRRAVRMPSMRTAAGNKYARSRAKLTQTQTYHATVIGGDQILSAGRAMASVYVCRVARVFPDSHHAESLHSAPASPDSVTLILLHLEYRNRIQIEIRSV